MGNQYGPLFCLDQKLISYRYSSSCCCSSSFCSSCWGDIFKKAEGDVVSNRIWMKFGRSVLHVNTHRLTKSDSWFYVMISRWRPWRHFMQQSAGAWRMDTQHLSSVYAAFHLGKIKRTFSLEQQRGVFFTYKEDSMEWIIKLSNWIQTHLYHWRGELKSFTRTLKPDS